MGRLKWQEWLVCEVCVKGTMKKNEGGVCGNMGGVNAMSCASRFDCWSDICVRLLVACGNK